jgi:hypothetical protein
MISTRLTALAVLLGAPAPSPARPPSLVGDPPIPLEPAYHGADVASAGDVDLDGSSDVIVGAWWDERGKEKGSATVFSGKTGKILFVLRGDAEDSLFGLSVAGGGDCNGDGTPDLVVGAPFQKVGGKSTGAVTVYSGRGGKVPFRLEGKAEGERFGWSVAMARDANLDGYADILVGAPGSSTLKVPRSGEVRLYSGKNGKPLGHWQGAGEDDEFGTCVAISSDANADGASDVIASSWRRGYVWLMSGKDGKPLHEWKGEASVDRFGWQLAGAGDTDQNGSGDILIAMPGASKDRARLFAGKSGELRHTFSLEEGKCFGYAFALAGAGDVNADGFADVAIADPGGPTALCDVTGTPLGAAFEKLLEPEARPGSVAVFSGHDGKPLFELHGDAKNDRFGVSVASAGDVDQDGFGDLVVGLGRESKVLARIYRGPKGELLHTLALEK